MNSGSEHRVPRKKKDRSTLPTLAVIVGCVLFAYGFSKGNALIQWALPAGLLVAAVAWTWWSNRET